MLQATISDSRTSSDAVVVLVYQLKQVFITDVGMTHLFQNFPSTPGAEPCSAMFVFLSAVFASWDPRFRLLMLANIGPPSCDTCNLGSVNWPGQGTIEDHR